jgi:hypothetical protein
MNDAELIALAVLAKIETEGMIAFNEERAHGGYAPAYGELMMVTNPSTLELRRELERRGVLKGEGSQ